MALFGKKKRVIEVGGQKIELEPKPSKGPFSFTGKKPQKPQPSTTQAPAMQQPQGKPQPPPQNANSQDVNKIENDFGRPQQKPAAKPKTGFNFFKPKLSKGELKLDIKPFETTKLEFPKEPILGAGIAQAASMETGMGAGAGSLKRPRKPNAFSKYVQKTVSKQKGLANALAEQGIKTDIYEFGKRMIIASAALTIVLTITLYVLFTTINLSIIESALFAVVMGFAIFQTASRNFLQYPLAKAKATSKNIERDILFAARDLIISLRSGMPLFNGITSISKGYGDASKEFAKIVDKVQLGMPLEDAIDDTIANTKSVSFRRIMLQASVSIKAGADVVGALQSIIEQLSQERIIELRSYGQKLNAIAMFYMLFGVILPSMGIAVVTILTTFIAIFTINVTIFEFVLVGIIALQVIFLKMITSSRPVFTM